MEFYPPKGSSFTKRIFKMVIFVAVIFVFSKLLHESKQLNLFPAYLNDIVFVCACAYIGWLFRMKNEWCYSKQGLIILASSNMFGFVFVVATVDGENKYHTRLWNPTSHSFSVNPNFELTIHFKPSEKVAVGGCHLLCDTQMIEPN